MFYKSDDKSRTCCSHTEAGARISIAISSQLLWEYGSPAISCSRYRHTPPLPCARPLGAAIAIDRARRCRKDAADPSSVRSADMGTPDDVDT